MSSLLRVDLVFINQEDLQERAQQVSVMREIYEKTAQGIIWLGEESDAIATAFTFIDNVTLKLCEYPDELGDEYDRDVRYQVL
jgi:Heterokaryon incompatibility protein (HET)